MRNFLLTLLLALAVFFGSTHAYAVDPEHHGAHAGSTHSAEHADGLDSGSQNSDAQGQGQGQGQGQDVAHSHVAMDAVPGSSGPGDRLFRTASLLLMRDAMALPSLGIAPPLEPPSA